MNEYKDLINKDTKFMMRDENGIETEMTTSEVINQLYQDNKALEHYINILQSKIYKVNEVLNQYMPNYASCVKALDEIEFILKEVEGNE